MSRMMKGSIIFLSLLIIGLVISVNGVISARATKTEVTGILDLSTPVIIDPGEVWVDKGGNIHTKNQVLEGAFKLVTASDEVIEGRCRLSLNGIDDGAGNGPSHGWFIDFIPALPGDDPTDDTILWEGTWQGMNVNFIFSGKFRGQGCGPYAGTKLNGTSPEVDASGEPADTSIYALEGRILDPHGTSFAPGKSGARVTSWGKMKAK